MLTMNTIAEKHTGLAYKVARSIASRTNHSVEDIAQAALLAACENVDKYDSSKGEESTFLYRWMMQGAMRFAYGNREVNIPEYLYIRVKTLNDCRSKDMSDTAIMEKTGWSASELQNVVDAAFAMRGLVSGFDTVGDSQRDTVFDTLESSDGESTPIADQICKALDCLMEREREVIEYRYGLNGRDTLNLREIGEMLNLTRQRVCQIEGEAMRKMQKVFA